MSRAVSSVFFRLGGVVASLGCTLGGMACTDVGDPPTQLLPAGLVAVQPRVELEGLVELSARSGGRLFVDEVVLHAGSVQIQDGAEVVADVLEEERSAKGPLLFRYSLVEGEAGELRASERLWDLSAGGPESELVFGFSPFQPSTELLDDLRAQHGFEGSTLSGHTAYLHGYMAVDEVAPMWSASALAHDDSAMAGDAEGDPADGSPIAGDAEGDPADGSPIAGDAEGDPADGSPIAGDAEGDPADGSSIAGDAEGDPARTGEANSASFGGRAQQTRGRSSSLVPFVLVLDNTLDLSMPLDAFAGLDWNEGEYLPLDLRVDVNHLLHDDRLRDLNAVVESAVAQGNEMASLHVNGQEASLAMDLSTQPVERRAPKKSPDEDRIRPTGDPRDKEGDER